MPKRGTKIHCPNCKAFAVCRAISPTEIGAPIARRWFREDYQDIAWFRRGRLCLCCGHKFLSAEVDEAFIEELVELRDRSAEKNKATIRSLRRRVPWLRREETIPLELAEDFVKASAWWLTHSSGSPVRARGHANRIYKSHHGWSVDFGGNSFLVGKAIERCRDILNQHIDDASKGRIPLRSELEAELRRAISGAVANSNGEEYNGYYPVTNDDLVFGAQSISVSDGARFILGKAEIADLLLSR